MQSWDNIFYHIASIIENEKEKLEKSGYKLDSCVFSVENSDIEMIIIQLEALNYICQKSDLSWDLTKQGRVKFLKMRAIKR